MTVDESTSSNTAILFLRLIVGYRLVSAFRCIYKIPFKMHCFRALEEQGAEVILIILWLFHD